MQIKEVQEKLKISSYTLRYYEKMGLIQPYRDENGYRNYNEEDIHILCDQVYEMDGGVLKERKDRTK